MARKRRESAVSVVVHDVDTRSLVTVGPMAPIWREEPTLCLPRLQDSCSGAFVRLQPPKNVDESLLDEVLCTVECVAVRVKVERQKKDEVVAPSMTKGAGKPREVVVELAGASKRDPASLLAFCEEVMAKEGF